MPGGIGNTVPIKLLPRWKKKHNLHAKDFGVTARQSRHGSGVAENRIHRLSRKWTGLYGVSAVIE